MSGGVTATLNRLRDADFFINRQNLVNLFARQLRHGQLTLALGAGVSFAFGLPQWDALTATAAGKIGVPPQPGVRNEMLAQQMLTRLGNDRLAFASHVRTVLYDRYDITLHGLLTHPLLVAIGSICTGSGRGSIREIVTFNFDDLLEHYLLYYGFLAQSIDIFPAWESRADVRVYHPHGLLPNDFTKAIRHPIVYAQEDFDAVVGDAKSDLRRTVLNVFSRHTCLFLGLSGNDQNLTNILREVKQIHPSIRRGDLWWGFRFSDDENDPCRDLWARHGVFQITVPPSYGEVPMWLLETCQTAAMASIRELNYLRE